MGFFVLRTTVGIDLLQAALTRSVSQYYSPAKEERGKEILTVEEVI